MKIVIDCYELIKGKSIGIYNYTKNLLKELIPLRTKNNKVIILTNSIKRNELEYYNLENVVIKRLPTSKLTKVKW